MSTSTIYVGIVTYNSLSDLPTNLESLKAQKFPQIVVTILDNASTEDIISWVQKNHPTIKVIQNPTNVGFARAHNLIIEQISFNDSDYYLALNPDVIMHPEYIERLVSGLQQYDADWGIGKLLLPDPTSPRIYSVGHALLRNGFAYNIGYGLPDGLEYNTSREIFGAAGAAVLYSAQFIQQIKCEGAFFDPRMFMYSEDVDVDWRGRRAGFRCWYIVDAVATHRGSNPAVMLQDIALANRFLMILKNAYWIDLIRFSLPQMSAHLLLRLLITPRRGVRIARLVLRHARSSIQYRSRPQASHATLKKWYKWSAIQPTNTPHTFRERWKSFKQHDERN